MCMSASSIYRNTTMHHCIQHLVMYSRNTGRFFDRNKVNMTSSNIEKMVQDGTQPRPILCSVTMKTCTSIYNTPCYEYSYTSWKVWNVLKVVYVYTWTQRSKSVFVTATNTEKMHQDRTWTRLLSFRSRDECVCQHLPYTAILPCIIVFSIL